MKKKRSFGEVISPIARNNLIHEIECFKREVEEQKALIESLEEEVAERARVHKEVVYEKQKSDQIIIEYHDKAERCK